MAFVSRASARYTRGDPTHKGNNSMAKIIGTDLWSRGNLKGLKVKEGNHE